MVETLVIAAQHRNHYYSRSRAQGPVRFDSFGSPPSRGFRDVNCRTFQYGAGILPTPLKAGTEAVAKQECSSPKTPSPFVKSHSEGSKHLKKSVKSSTTPISIDIRADPIKEGFFNGEFSYSELWAGPAYSNSPPPSSLPMPKFTLRPKRTVSLELPATSASDINFHPAAKSAPPSPTRDRSSSSSRDLFHSVDSATKNLRRILNLDIADE